MESINLNQLKYFYTVAVHESYTKAAQQLNIQQPALSKTIRNLEEDLNIKLFQKSGRNIELTSRGEKIFQDCHSIFRSIDEILFYSKEDELLLPDTLNICGNDAILAELVIPTISKLSLINKGVRPVITTGTAAMLMAFNSKRATSTRFLFSHPKTSRRFNDC